MEMLVVPGQLDSLETIRSFITSAAAKSGLDKLRTYRLTLAVDEIATNIISYGYKGSGLQGDVRVLANSTDTGLEITLEDTAPPYDPFAADQPVELDAPIEERQIGGLGVFLAVNGVDQFRYEYVDGYNRNIFFMNADRHSS
jgi:serine/threonine-protein kinase RsbW